MYRLLTLIFFSVSAMASAPTFTVGTDPIIDITGTGTGLSLGDDQMSGMKNIGFDFTFYDQTFSQVNISMNGFFTFQSNFSVPRSRNYLSETLPATSFNYSVFPAWSDYIRRSSGNQSPYIETFGQTSDTDQYFVIMWDNVSEYSNGLKSTFQAILYETTNEISFRYDELRIQNHDLTIGVQGNNEAVTYLRYEDTNSSTYDVTDDFSLTTAEVIDESFSNLSSECLVDADYSELCDVYDLSFDIEEDDDYYLQGSGVSDAMLLGYDDEEDFYGFNTEEIYTGASVLYTDADTGSDPSAFHDDYSGTSYIEYDIWIELEDDETIDNIDLQFDGDFAVLGSEEGTLSFIELDIGGPEDILELPSVDILPEITLTEEEFVEFAQHMDEHFEEEIFEEVEEPVEEQLIVEEEIEEQYEEELLEEEEEALDEAVDEISPEEVDEDKPRRNSRARSIIASTNTLLSNVNATVNRSISSSTSNNAVSNNIGASGSTGSVSPSSTTNSPSISDQIASSQAQTNTVLQSINITPMPTVGDSPAVVMAEVQVTSIDNQIESMTSTMVSASEADQIANEIVSNNIRAQQEESQQQQEETGEYDTQGQATLIAYMNYVPNFTSYTEYSIPDQATWYEPTVIYADAMLRDNASAFSGLVTTSSEKLYDMMGQQPVNIFIERR